MLKSLSLAALLIGSVSAEAANQNQMGLRCHSFQGAELSASVFYAVHEEPGLFKPAMIEMVSPSTGVSQTCVMGQNRLANESPALIRMVPVRGNPCGAIEGQLVAQSFAEIQTTRETTPSGEVVFKANLHILIPSSGNRFIANLQCQILPL
ncbi:MAG: hypothetical protein AB7T49_19270 [Oligoflexales bacterium]